MLSPFVTERVILPLAMFAKTTPSFSILSKPATESFAARYLIYTSSDGSNIVISIPACILT